MPLYFSVSDVIDSTLDDTGITVNAGDEVSWTCDAAGEINLTATNSSATGIAAKLITSNAAGVNLQLTNSGGFTTSITTAATAARAVAFGDVAGTVVTDTGAQTLTSKRLTTPFINSATATIGYNLTVYGVGTAYSLTNAAAAITLGTTSPTKILDTAGTYLIMGQVHLAYTGATVIAETAAIKVRRTTNTAADLSVVVPIDLPVATTLTHTYGIFQIPPFVYSTSATDDSLSIFANVSAALGAGTIDAVAIGTSLVCVRLY